MKYSFYNDYTEGCHPKILNALNESNLIPETGYGEDTFSNKAAELIRSKIKNPTAAVHFVSGGTQANLIVLAALLKPYEAVISASTGHINIHEAGAIETTGHKILPIQSLDGKITPDQIIEVINFHSDEHMVKPKVVFISNSTELGTIYKKKELENLSQLCKEKRLYLYLDGARLGSALTSTESDVSIADLAKLLDIFYIGGTKNGALLGEAIIINNPSLQENFRYHLKQRGALLAKGRVLGIQFQELFKENLYFELALHANKMANDLVVGIKKQGYNFLSDSATNQIFPILPNKVIEKLEQIYGFYIWSKTDEHNLAIRLVTSWATTDEAVKSFLKDLEALSIE